jgi:preprotein translocase subunit SecF
MSRRAIQSTKSQTPIDKKQKELEAQLAKIQAEMEKNRSFLNKAPQMKEEVEQKQKNELVARHHRPVRIEGPADFRYEFRRGKQTASTLRKEKSIAPLITIILLVAFLVVAVYAWRMLLHG